MSTLGETPLPKEPHTAYDALVPPDLIKRVTEAIARGARATILLGEPGSGKGFLAEVAARHAAHELPGVARACVLPRPPRPDSGVVYPAPRSGPGAASLRELTETDGAIRRALAELPTPGGADSVCLVALDIDEYDSRDLRALSRFADAPGTIVVATAARLTPALDREHWVVAGAHVSIGPLTVAHASRVAAGILGVDEVEPATARRWLAAARGNSYELVALVRAQDHAGSVRRTDGIAWAPGGPQEGTGSYADRLAETCSPGEWDALEFVAVAEPVTEPALLRVIDTAATSRLLDQRLLLTQQLPNGPGLVLGHPLLADAIRARMNPLRRFQLASEVFRALDADRGRLDPVYLPERLTRLVVFGIAAGGDIPVTWLWAALAMLGNGGEPRLVLRVALAVAAHPEATAEQAGYGAFRAIRLARLVGDDVARRSMLARIVCLVTQPMPPNALTPEQRLALELVVVREDLREGTPCAQLLERLDRFARNAGSDIEAEMVAGTRLFVLAYSGRLREAVEWCPPTALSPDAAVESTRATARAMAALLLEQRGDRRAAASNATHARHFSRLETSRHMEQLDLHGFCTLVGHWVHGDQVTGARILDELLAEASADTHAEAHFSGLVELGSILFAIQEGNWRQARVSAERLLSCLAHADGYGLAPMVRAALALACAAGGDGAEARRARAAAEDVTPGLSLALDGFRRLLLVRASQWLWEDSAPDRAAQLAEWAEREDLPLIELEARHVRAYTTRHISAADLTRVRNLAGAVDPVLGDALLRHAERLREGVCAGGDGDSAEVSALADLGLWLPPPPGPTMTGRQREIMQLAAVGYSSKRMASRLGISTRTIETHLGHVFQKLGVANRDELRAWIAEHRDEMALKKLT